MFKSLSLKNFTVFESVEIEWSSGLNVLIGANGTGKTHLLKLLYCLQSSGYQQADLEKKLGKVFRPKGDLVSRLVRRKRGSTECVVHAVWDKQPINVSFSNKKNWQVSGAEQWKCPDMPVYIPVKEMLSFAAGFRSLYEKYDLPFEEIYYDALKLAYLPSLKGAPLDEKMPLLEAIRKLMGGKIVIEGETFYLKHGGSSLEISLVAEGHRKLALLWLLIHNGALFDSKTLYWDEPESNLNPSLMPDLVKILLMLAERGVQIFVATHNYALLKEIEYQRQQVPTQYVVLEATKDKGVLAHSFAEYSELAPNKIAEEYQRLYDLEIQRSLGRVS
jgi:energy-coupling factor transporter ATP-binding protein EcfA2